MSGWRKMLHVFVIVWGRQNKDKSHMDEQGKRAEGGNCKRVGPISVRRRRRRRRGRRSVLRVTVCFRFSALFVFLAQDLSQLCLNVSLPYSSLFKKKTGWDAYSCVQCMSHVPYVSDTGTATQMLCPCFPAYK